MTAAAHDAHSDGTRNDGAAHDAHSDGARNDGAAHDAHSDGTRNDGAANDARGCGAPVVGRPPPLPPGARVLLVGIGNDLRGDDGAGPRVARALVPLVAWEVRAAHGLAPEMVDDLARCDAVLFVDASADPTLERPTWTRHHVEAARLRSPLLGHSLDVPALLALTMTLHERAPAAATLALPAREFDLGERLSPIAAAGVRAAIESLTVLAARQAEPIAHERAGVVSAPGG